MPTEEDGNAHVDNKQSFRLWYNFSMIPLFKSRVAVFAIGLMLVGATVAYAQVWTPPTADFPNGNVSVPVTTGSSTQWKSGTLYANQFLIATTSPATFNAMTFPQNKGIGGMVGATQRTVLYPYAGASWGLYLQSYTAGGGIITLRSGDTGTAMLQLRPDGRINATGVFVLPNRATTSVAVTARVPGAMVFTNGAPYFYKNVAEGWVPVGSGAGGGGGGWTLAGTPANPLLYTTSQTANVGVGTTNPTAALEIRGDTRIDKTLYSSVWLTGWKYRVLGYISGASNIACNTTAYTAWSNDSELRGTILPGGNFSQYQITTDRTGGPTTPPTNGTRLCNDSDVNTPQCDLPPDGAWDADATAPLRVYDFYVDRKLGGVCSPGIVELVREPALQEGGNLLVTGTASAGQFCLGGQCISDWTSGGVWVLGSAGSISYSGGNVGVGTSTPTSRLSVSTPTDNAFQLDRSGAATPVLFKAGTDGGLVLNTNAKNTLYVKDGKVSVGGDAGSELLEVQGGNLSVNVDPSLTGFVYESNTAVPGTWDPGHTLIPACECESDPNSAADCADTFYASDGSSPYCYNYSQAYDGSRGGYYDISYTYDRVSAERQAKGGIGQFQNKVVIGHPSVGTTPILALKPAGSPNYTILNADGTLRFNNSGETTRLSLGQDGMMNLISDKTTNYGYGFLTTVSGAAAALTKAIAVNTTAGVDQFVVYGNGSVGIGTSTTFGVMLNVMGTTTISGTSNSGTMLQVKTRSSDSGFQIKRYQQTVTGNFTWGSAWTSLNTRNFGSYVVSVKGAGENYPSGIWNCVKTSGNQVGNCNASTTVPGFSTGLTCAGPLGITARWAASSPIQFLFTTNEGPACNLSFNITVTEY